MITNKDLEKMYTPKPIRTDDVTLSDDLLKLIEKLAENTHDVWAEGRIKEGWTYGEKRDDTLKHHPCLVKYSELSESEKEFDRNTAMETLKLIIKLGYNVNKEE